LRKPFLICCKRHTPLVHKIWVREIFSFFDIISTHKNTYRYIHQKLDTRSCFAKLRAISNLFSFFIHPVYIRRNMHVCRLYYYAPSLRCCWALCGVVNGCLLAIMQSSLPLWLFELSGPITLCACLDALSDRVVPHALVRANSWDINTSVSRI
jgi:hypothetical protein